MPPDDDDDDDDYSERGKNKRFSVIERLRTRFVSAYGNVVRASWTPVPPDDDYRETCWCIFRIFGWIYARSCTYIVTGVAWSRDTTAAQCPHGYRERRTRVSRIRPDNVGDGFRCRPEQQDRRSGQSSQVTTDGRVPRVFGSFFNFKTLYCPWCACLPPACLLGLFTWDRLAPIESPVPSVAARSTIELQWAVRLK